MCRTTPFQNPATARTAGSCERTGATKAPVLSPAILPTGGFTLGFGVKACSGGSPRLPPHGLDKGRKRVFVGTGMPPRPHSPDTGAHRGKCGRNCLGLNDRGEMDSSLSPAYQNPAGRRVYGRTAPGFFPCPLALGPPKVGPGFCPELRLAYSRTRCLPCPAGRQEISARILCRQHT